MVTGNSRAERFYTPGQVAMLLQVRTITVHRWLREGKLKGFRIGRLWRISHYQLEEFLAFEFDILEHKDRGR